MTRLIASELIHNSIYDITTPGPLTRHSDNDSTLDAVQRTLQELELLDGGAEAALAQLARGSNNGLYPQLLELQRRYTALASPYLTREKKALSAAQLVSDNAESVSAILGTDIIVIRAPSLPDAYTRLWDALVASDASVTIQLVAHPKSGEHNGAANADMRFYSTTSATDEPRAVIRNIVDDLRRGITLGEIAVLYPSREYASRIKDALNAANIRNCGLSNLTLAETPIGRFVSCFLKLIVAEMRRDAFTSWTTTAPVIDPADGSRVLAVPWEAISRDAKISRFSADVPWRRSLDRYASMMRNRAKWAEIHPDFDVTVDPQALHDAADNADRLKDFVTELVKRIEVDEPRSWTSWVSWLEEIITVYLAPKQGSNDQRLTGWNQFQKGIEQIRDLQKVAYLEVDLMRFARVVDRMLAARVGSDSGWGSSVLVGSLKDCVGTAFKSVHIVGMEEGGLPGARTVDPLLSDRHRRQLDSDGSKLSTSSSRLEVEHQVFKLALNCAPLIRLYWNKALLGATNESYPSPWFVQEVTNLNNLASIPVKTLMDPRSDYLESVVWMSDLSTTDFQASSDYEFDLQEVATYTNNENGFDALLQETRNSPMELGAKVVASRFSHRFGSRDGNIAEVSDPSVGLTPLSANALQTYAECPYRFFLLHTLNVDARNDPEDSLTLSPLERGILVHTILEKYFNEFGFDDTREGLEGLRRVARDEIDRFQREEYIGYEAIFDLEKSHLLRQLNRWHSTSMDVLRGYEGELKTEEFFGDYDDLGRFILKDGYVIRLRGKIDLIAKATSSNRVLVVDFKSGSSDRYLDIEKDITASGTKLQLPIYANIASEMFGPDADIHSAYWFVFETGGKRIRPASPVTLEDANERFAPVLTTIVNGIRNGRYPANPGNRDQRVGVASWKNCRYCAYTDVCPENRLIAWDRKKSSPDLHDYAMLTEGET